MIACIIMQILCVVRMINTPFMMAGNLFGSKPTIIFGKPQDGELILPNRIPDRPIMISTIWTENLFEMPRHQNMTGEKRQSVDNFLSNSVKLFSKKENNFSRKRKGLGSPK